MKCIYNGKTEKEASFMKREHVFPAGLGGKNMLNQGDVSDEVNEFFSKLELEFMRESIIQIPRIFLGPGKRGSLNKKKATKSKIFLMNNENTFKIGYIELGIPKTISQIRFYNDSIRVNLIPQSKEENIKILLKFKKNLIEKIRIKIKKSKKLESNTIIVGFNDDKKEEIIYIYHNYKDFSLINLIDYIENKEIFEKIRNNYKEEYLNKTSEEGMEVSTEIAFNLNSYYRVCCKIALNGLCFLKGRDFVSQENFVDIKKFILNNEENKFINLTEENIDIQNMLTKLQIPKYSHFMFFFIKENDLCCFLGIYGFLHQIYLAKIYNNDLFLDGLICDWQNNKEYNLCEYLLEKSTDKNFFNEYFN